MIGSLPAGVVSRLVEESPDAVVIIDQHGAIRYLNAAMQALSGFGIGEAMGQPLDGLLPENLVSRHRGYVREYVENGTWTNVLGHVREFAIRHRTGKMIPVEMKALDLDVIEGTRYFGAFMSDLRGRREIEAKNLALVAQLEQLALTDPLTGLPNRRAFEAEADRALARARRSGAPVTVAVVDIDHFKGVNDDYGHPAGDLVLCAVAKAVEESARASDVVARIGGEEFGILLPGAAPETARLVAERIRMAVQAFSVALADGATVAVTLSIGLAALSPRAALADALAAADGALYQAKNNGRNRVESA